MRIFLLALALAVGPLLASCAVGAPTENCGEQASAMIGGSLIGPGDTAFVGFSGSNANQWCAAVAAEYPGLPTKAALLPGEPQTCQYQLNGATATLQDTGSGLEKGYSWTNWLDCRTLAKWAANGTPP